MGAPTGSAEVLSSMCPRDTGWRAFPEAKPLMVTVAAPATECFLMAAQVAGSGIQVWAAACWGVRAGGLLVGATQRGSISPMRIRSPLAVACMVAEPSV